MNRKSLAILMRARMRRPNPPPPSSFNQTNSPSHPNNDDDSSTTTVEDGGGHGDGENFNRELAKDVKEWMHASISISTGRTESVDSNLEGFLQGYLSLPGEGRWEMLVELARDYDVNRVQVRDLMQQYLSLELPHGVEDENSSGTGHGDESALAALYRTERNLRDALRPMYAVFFERLNAHPGGLKLLVIIRADLLSLLTEENTPSVRAIESYLKEKLSTWLSPAALELHQITWDDSASLLEKIVAYEAVHPIRNLLDLKRRLSVGPSLLWISTSSYTRRATHFY